MIQGIDPVTANMRLAQLLGSDDLLAQAPAAPAAPAALPGMPAASATGLTGNPFDDALSKAVESLNMVSQSEIHANQLVDQYMKGQADLQDVMVAQSKMNIMMQLAVTSINAAVGSFKEITQIQM